MTSDSNSAATSGHPDLRFATFLAPKLMPMYEAIAHAVGRRLGLSTELVVEDDYERCLEDEHEVCFVCSLPYIMFDREDKAPAVPIAAPVLCGDRYEGSPIYFSDVIVRYDSPLSSFLDLRDHSWAYNEPWSQSGYGVTRYHLLSLGETNGFFGDVVESGFHEESIRMVANGLVDASAIDSQVLEIELMDNPDLGRMLRVIDVLGPSTIQPIAVSKRLPERLQAAIREVLLGLHEDADVRPLLRSGLVDHFVPVGASSYDDIRAMVEACEAAGYMELA